MKKIKLKFQKRVISVLSGEDLAKVWGGAKKYIHLILVRQKKNVTVS